MECDKVKSLLPGYLDGALQLDTGAETHLSIGRHLEQCEECREDLQSYLALSSLMSRVERPAPPADLAVQIRVAAAQRQAAQQRIAGEGQQRQDREQTETRVRHYNRSNLGRRGHHAPVPDLVAVVAARCDPGGPCRLGRRHRQG